MDATEMSGGVRVGRAAALEGRPLGDTAVAVSLLGLGGNRLLTKRDGRREAVRLVGRALDLGVTFFDTARLYTSSEIFLGEGLEGRRDEIFLASKTHARDRRGGLDAQLHETLRRLRTGRLDLWQLHDVQDRRGSAQDLRRRRRGGGPGRGQGKRGLYATWA